MLFLDLDKKKEEIPKLDYSLLEKMGITDKIISDFLESIKIPEEAIEEIFVCLGIADERTTINYLLRKGKLVLTIKEKEIYAIIPNPISSEKNPKEILLKKYFREKDLRSITALLESLDKE